MAERSGRQAKVEREARLRWVPIPEMQVSELAQRDLNPARVRKIAETFDLEQLGTLTVNLRDNTWYIIDGQHRVEALKAIGYGDQQVQCWAYEGLSEQDEAEKFLKLNDVLAVSAFHKFKVGVQAGRQHEVNIDRIVTANSLRIAATGDNAISAVGTLRRIYDRSGAETLDRTLRIVRDAYGDPGLNSAVLDGVGLVCERYDGTLEDDRVVRSLSRVHGGLNALLGKAENIRKQTGNPKHHCVAAAAVEIINAGRGGRKLASWWKSEQ